MKIIKEVIVVEGNSDKAHLSEFLDADILVCNGSAIDGFDINYLKVISKDRGVIIFTDPDYPGERIRKYINANIDNCKNAFVKKVNAIKGHKLGVAETPKKYILEALENIVTFTSIITNSINYSDLYDLGLIGKEDSAVKREKICDFFHVGHCNAKTMTKRLNMLRITKKDIERIYDKQ